MKNLETILKEKPMGLDRSVGRVISKHRGSANGITREALLTELHKQAHLVNTTDRHMRMAIETFRKLGVRICHTETRQWDEGEARMRVVFCYYLAANEEEYREFRARYLKYATSIWNTTQAMDDERPVLNEDGEVSPPKTNEVQGKLPLNF